MGRKSISIHTALFRFSENIRWGYVTLRIAGGFVIAVLIYMAFLWSGSDKTIHYAQADVIYGEKIHAVHDMGSVTYPQNSNTYAADSKPKPFIRLSEHFYDFGGVEAQQVLTHTFVIANSGTSTLKIRRAYTTCGCTTADFTAAEIPPGKVALITLIFDTSSHDMRGNTVRRGVIIESNDPDHPVEEIWIQASVK